jgi:uncharacterized protein (TIGR02246 family)
MKRIVSTTFVVLLVAFTISILPPAVSAQTASDADAINKLLIEFLAGASRNDPAVHERFWADDLIYTGSGGRRRGKAEIMRDVRSAPAAKPADPITVYSAEDIRIQQYGNTAVLAFRLVATTKNAGTTEISSYLNSGTFVKRDGKWQVVNWQSTKVPAPGGQPGSETAKSADVAITLPPELARVLTDYEAGWKAGDAAALARLFAEDGFVLPNGREPVKGRAAIEKLYTRQGSPLFLRAFAYATCGDVGYILGGYSYAMGQPEEGKFTLLLRKGEGGRWLIVSDMDSPNRRRN